MADADASGNLHVSPAMIVRLVKLRRAHPGVRVRWGTRLGQAVVGFMSAASTAVVLWASTIDCLSS
jgi:hypothetical protein